MRNMMLILLLAVTVTTSPEPPRAVLVEPASTTTTWRVSWTGLTGRVGTHAVARGALAGPERAGRVVRVITRLPGAWHELARTRSRADGSFRLPIRHSWYGARALRLQVLPTATSPAILSGAVPSRVTPGYRPPGNPRDYALMGGGPGRFRFDPCRTITWRINDVSGRHLRLARTGFARLGQATGLRFRYLGPTGHDPARTAGWPADTAVIVGFGGHWRTAWPVRPFGGWATPRLVAGAVDATGRTAHEIRAGGAWINTPLLARSGRHAAANRLHVLLHELGHVVGLLHSTGGGQQMGSFIRGLPSRYGAGDLTGLRAVGRNHGCLSRAGDGYWAGGVDDIPARRSVAHVQHG